MNYSNSTVHSDLLADEIEEEHESPGDHRRMASYHFSQAAKQHELAAEAYENGDHIITDMHAFNAYRHHLIANQYAESAIIDAVESDSDQAE